MPIDTNTDESLELTTPDENNQVEHHTDAPDPAEQQQPAGDDDQDAEVSVSFGETTDDEPEEVKQAPQWVKDLRKREREQAKRLKQQEREIEQLRTPTGQSVQIPQVRDKPTLEMHEFDPVAYEADLEKWVSEKSAADAKTREIEIKQQQEAQAAQQHYLNYQQRAKALNRPDYEQVELRVANALSPVQRSLMLEASDKTEMLVVALDNDPTQLERLSKITNAAKFAAEIGKLEGQLKVSKVSKAKPSVPDTNLSSTRASTTTDKQLEKLEQQARDTGDRTALNEYKRKLKSKS